MSEIKYQEVIGEVRVIKHSGKPKYFVKYKSELIEAVLLKKLEVRLGWIVRVKLNYNGANTIISVVKKN